MKNIFIFSDEIGIGKTTTLKEWVKHNVGITGFLSPLINSERHFQNIETGETQPMETKNEGLEIGKHNFNPEVFEWAEIEIYRQFQSDKKWLVIDEIGPLEIRKEKGFHQLLLKLFKEYSDEKPNLLFVVRDFMVEEFIEKYDLKKVKILPKNFFKNQELQPLKGLVLCGGESKRMESDKALLKYSNEIQWKKIRRMLDPFCNEVAVSVNNVQWKNWASKEEGNFILDAGRFKNNGPFTGLMSANEKFSNTGFFVVGIDYPYLETRHLVTLFNAREENFDAVCFEKNGFTEPLISIIEENATAKLQDFFKNGGNSINQFLKQINTKKVRVSNTDFLTNINHKEDFLKFNS